MKKLLSITLAVLMLISSMTCLFTGTVSAEGEAAATETLPVTDILKNNGVVQPLQQTDHGIITKDTVQQLKGKEYPGVYYDVNGWNDVQDNSYIDKNEIYQLTFEVTASADLNEGVKVYPIFHSNNDVNIAMVDFVGVRHDVTTPDVVETAYNYVANAYNKDDGNDATNEKEIPSLSADKAAPLKAGTKYLYTYIFKTTNDYINLLRVVADGITQGNVHIGTAKLFAVNDTDAGNFQNKGGNVVIYLNEQDGNTFVRMYGYRDYGSTDVKKYTVSANNGGDLYSFNVEGGKNYALKYKTRIIGDLDLSKYYSPSMDLWIPGTINYTADYAEILDETDTQTTISVSNTAYSGPNNGYAYLYAGATSSTFSRRIALNIATVDFYDANGTHLGKGSESAGSGQGRTLKNAVANKGWIDATYNLKAPNAQTLQEAAEAVEKLSKSNAANMRYRYVDGQWVYNSAVKNRVVPTPQTETVAIAMEYLYSGMVYDYDDFCFEEVVSVNVSSAGNGSASASAATATVGSTVTLTAKSHGGDFLGWYDGDTMLSKDITYVHTVTGATNIVAKFTGIKAVWKEKTYLEVKEDLDVAPYKNGPVYKVSNAINYQAAYAELNGLAPNTRYSFTVYHKGNVLFANGVGAMVESAGGKYTDADGKKWDSGMNWVVPAASGTDNNLTNNVWANGQYWPGEGYWDNCLKKITAEPFVDADTWQKIEFVFDTNATDTDYILIFKYTGKAEGATDPQICYLSDANVSEYVKVEAPAAAAVEVEETTANSVTLKATEGYEYKVNDGEWQTSNVFEGLDPETEYTFYQRQAEDSFYLAGPASEGLKVKTPAAFTPGNVDDDENNTIDLNDVVALAQIVAGWEDVKHNPAALDIDGNGEVDLNDVVTLAQFVAGWDVEIAK